VNPAYVDARLNIVDGRRVAWALIADARAKTAGERYILGQTATSRSTALRRPRGLSGVERRR